MTIASTDLMTTRHAAVWMDHNEARIFFMNANAVEALNVRSPNRHVRRHPTSRDEKTHPADAKRFFDEVARAVDGATEILIVGPSTAKLEFIRYLHAHARELEARVVGIETVDHPSDAQLVAFVRRYFRAIDRMRGTSP
jgi:stalled ribosome rescue protein Dom34